MNSRRPSVSAPMRKEDFQSMQRHIAAQAVSTTEVHTEVIRAVSIFRHALGDLVGAAENLSTVIGKLTLSSMTSGQMLKDFNLGGSEMDVETRRRQLNAATQQLAKFFTAFAAEQRALASATALDVEAPMQMILDAHRDVMQNWERDLDKTVRRYESEVKHLESESQRAGKKNNAELSSVLHALTAKMAEFERAKRDRLASVLTRDNNQHLSFIHHLQTMLRCHLECLNHCLKQDHHPGTAPATPITPSTPRHDFYKLRSAGQTAPALLSSTDYPPSSPAEERERQDVLTQLASDAVPHRQSRSRHERTPSNASSSSTSSSGARGKPRVPANPHRKTTLPESNDLERLQSFIETNFTADVSSAPKKGGITPKFLRDTMIPKPPVVASKSKKEDIDSVIERLEHEAFASSTDEDTLESLPLSLVLYNFDAQTDDDLGVREGDAVRVVSVEEEWIYALQVDVKSMKPLEPMRVGWIPLSFTAPLPMPPSKDGSIYIHTKK